MYINPVAIFFKRFNREAREVKITKTLQEIEGFFSL
jgi:hypothetical protein